MLLQLLLWLHPGSLIVLEIVLEHCAYLTFFTSVLELDIPFHHHTFPSVSWEHCACTIFSPQVGLEILYFYPALLLDELVVLCCNASFSWEWSAVTPLFPLRWAGRIVSLHSFSEWTGSCAVYLLSVWLFGLVGLLLLSTHPCVSRGCCAVKFHSLTG